MTEIPREATSQPIHAPFQRFGALLQNPEAVKRIRENDPEGADLTELLQAMKKYAWEKCGYVLTEGRFIS